MQALKECILKEGSNLGAAGTPAPRRCYFYRGIGCKGIANNLTPPSFPGEGRW